MTSAIAALGIASVHMACTFRWERGNIGTDSSAACSTEGGRQGGAGSSCRKIAVAAERGSCISPLPGPGRRFRIGEQDGLRAAPHLNQPDAAVHASHSNAGGEG